MTCLSMPKRPAPNYAGHVPVDMASSAVCLCTRPQKLYTINLVTCRCNTTPGERTHQADQRVSKTHVQKPAQIRRNPMDPRLKGLPGPTGPLVTGALTNTLENIGNRLVTRLRSNTGPREELTKILCRPHVKLTPPPRLTLSSLLAPRPQQPRLPTDAAGSAEHPAKEGGQKKRGRPPADKL